MSAGALSKGQPETLLTWPTMSFEVVYLRNSESRPVLPASAGRASEQGGLQPGAIPLPEVSATTHCVQPGGGGAPQSAARRALRRGRFPESPRRPRRGLLLRHSLSARSGRHAGRGPNRHLIPRSRGHSLTLALRAGSRQPTLPCSHHVHLEVRGWVLQRLRK